MTQLTILLTFAQLMVASGFLNSPQRLIRSATVENSRLWAKQNKNKNEGFDTKELKELKRRINEVRNPYNELFPVDWSVQPDSVHVIVFNPNTAQQGMHSIEQATGNQFVLAFESKEDCESFAATLEQQNFQHPITQQYDFDALEELCDKLGVFIQLVPAGKEIRPPTRNVESLGQHNPQLKKEKIHLDYLFDMFGLEVDDLGIGETEEVGSWE